MKRNLTARNLLLLVILPAFLATGSIAPAAAPRYAGCFPDVPGYETLVCDLHMHTVFSDGNVWPTVRVDEAWRQGLDVLSITDHIEYQPHKGDVPTNHNRPTELVTETAKVHNLILIRGTEITRDTPPGHYNALFLKDVNPLDTEGFLDAIAAANEQGAFVFWNHHDWKGEDRGNWSDVQTEMVEKKWLHGMEVANGDTYYPRAHQWCLDRDLTMVGNTDIHSPDLRTKSTPEDHRSMTLVFAKDRTAESVKEALFAKRTAVWLKNQLIGREDVLAPLFAACVHVKPVHHRGGNTVYFEIENVSNVDIRLQKAGDLGPAVIELPAKATTLVQCGVGDASGPYELRYAATNFLIAPEKGLPVTFKVQEK